MDFEQAFSDFLETKEYDEAERALFEITRQAFRAGWIAAQSNTTPKNKILELNNSNKE